MTTSIRTVAPVEPDSRDYNLSVLGVLRLWLSHWRLLIGVPLLAAVIAIGLSYLRRPDFASRVRFVPQSQQRGGSLGNLMGLATQFGINLGAGDVSEGPHFFAALAQSRPVVIGVLLAHYSPTGEYGDSASGPTLLDWLEVDEDEPPARRLELGMEELKDRTTISVEPKTNIITLDVRMPSATVAAAVANAYLSNLMSFNLHNRQSQARAKRIFVESRTAYVEKALTAAEEDLKRFYDKNRLWESSPALQFEESRLRRRLDGQQEVYLSLRRELETAGINEVNDTPVLNVIEPPVVPMKKARPRRLQWGWIAGSLTGLALLVGTLLYEHRDHWRTLDPTSYEWFARRLRRA